MRSQESTRSSTAPRPTASHRTLAAVTAAVALLAGGVATAGTAAAADEIPVVAYDVASTPEAGWGGWSHLYNGTQTFTGRTVPGSGGPNGLYDYTEGSFGTINDGVDTPTSVSQAHLLTWRPDAAGVPIEPVITLKLPGPYFVDSVKVFGGDIAFNALPGALQVATIAVNGASAASVPGQPFGTGTQTANNDLFDVSAALGGLPTDTVVLSNFTSSFTFNGTTFALDQADFAEITVQGRSAVPTLEVAVDVKPGDQLSTISLRSRVTTVAVLSSADFDAPAEIDRTSVTFGAPGDEGSVRSARVVDVNRDRRPDLLFEASTALLGLSVGDTQARLKGVTFSGQPAHGADSVRVIR
jgi:hypothetical protein